MLHNTQRLKIKFRAHQKEFQVALKCTSDKVHLSEIQCSTTNSKGSFPSSFYFSIFINEIVRNVKRIQSVRHYSPLTPRLPRQSWWRSEFPRIAAFLDLGQSPCPLGNESFKNINLKKSNDLLPLSPMSVSYSTTPGLSAFN